MNKLCYREGARPGKKRPESRPTCSTSTGSSVKTINVSKRTFQKSWKVDRPWLVYNIEKGMMSCTYCAAYPELFEKVKVKGDDNNFVSGSTNLRKSSVTEHSKSRFHTKAQAMYLAKHTETHALPQSVAGKAIRTMKEKERGRLRLLFRNAHALAAHNRPMSDFGWMVQLDTAKGLDTGTTYLNEYACAQFIDCIGSVVEAGVVQDIKDASFVSLTMDGTTDLSTREQETLFVRTSLKGEIKTRFLQIGEPKSTRSEDLFSLVTDIITDLGLTNTMSKKLVGFTCDGASNMMGVNRGTATLLQETYPTLVVTHCLAHRLELAFKDAIKASGCKLYDRTSTLLVGLYYFYQKSSKQRKALREAFKALALTPAIPPRVGGTRWLAHIQRAVDSCLKGYPALVAQLSNASHGNAKAEGLVKILTNWNVVAFLLLLKVQY